MPKTSSRCLESFREKDGIRRSCHCHPAECKLTGSTYWDLRLLLASGDNFIALTFPSFTESLQFVGGDTPADPFFLEDVGDFSLLNLFLWRFAEWFFVDDFCLSVWFLSPFVEGLFGDFALFFGKANCASSRSLPCLRSLTWKGLTDV